MRPTLLVALLALTISGCVLPSSTGPKRLSDAQMYGSAGSAVVSPTGAGLPQTGLDTLTQSGQLAGSNVVSAGGGNVISAGGGNVISAGGGNVISAGGGNVISAGGGNLSGSSASGLIASGSSLSSPDGTGLVPGGNGNTPGENIHGGNGSENPPPAETGVPMTLTGHVRMAGALVDTPLWLCPVIGTKVGLYDLEGQPVGAPVTTDAAGNFTLANVTSGHLYALRTQFTVGAKAYYLSAVIKPDTGAGDVTLDPVSTVTEAKFFVTADGVLPADSLVASATLVAFHTASAAFNRNVELGVLAANATLATRAADYDALAAKYAGAFELGVGSWDWLGALSGSGGSGASAI